MPESQGLIPNADRIRELEDYYRVMGMKITDQFATLSSGFSVVGASRVRKDIDKDIREMNRFIIKWTKKAVPESYREASKIARVSLDILGAKKDEFFDNKTHFHTIDEQEDITIDAFIAANQSIKLTMGTYLYLLGKADDKLASIQAFDLRDEETIAGLLDDEIRKGASRGKLQQILRVHFERDLYKRKFININGRNYDMIKYAETVARTRLRIVQTEAILNMCNQFENDLVEVSDHSSEWIDQCLDYEGNIYSISGKNPGYPYLDQAPPYHMRCGHSIMPTSVEAIAWRKDN